jgi:hypothetical protein
MFEPKEGVKVLANFSGDGFWEPGVISNLNDDGTFNVAYDDGDEEDNVLRENVKEWAEEAASDDEDQPVAKSAAPAKKRGVETTAGLAATGAGMKAADGDYRALPQAEEGGKAEFIKTDK